MASLPALLSTLHFFLFSVLPLALSMTLYAILPQSLFNRLRYLLSTLHQLFNLTFSRLLPTLLIPTTSLNGKTAIVTGANSGIGYQITLSLVRLGAAVLLAVRSESKGRDAVQSILEAIPDAKGRVKFSILDTSSFSSVQAFASKWQSQSGGQQIDILCHNAGITQPPFPLTSEGIETVYATNFLGSFLLTHLLEKHLSPSARIIFTSSTGQLSAKFTPYFSTQSVRGMIEPGFHAPCFSIPILGLHAWNPARSSQKYAQTKGMQCAFVRRLQRRFDTNTTLDKDGKVLGRRTAHTFTPGFTMTPIFGKIQSGTSFLLDLIKDPSFTLLTVTTFAATDVTQGAMTGLWLASAPEEEIAGADEVGREPGGGGYWDRLHREMSVADIMSDKMLDRLWERWEADAGIEWK